MASAVPQRSHHFSSCRIVKQSYTTIFYMQIGGVEALNRTALFGNNFETYDQEVPFRNSSVAESVTQKDSEDDYFTAFHDSEKELQLN
ncbi:hypothetical protein V6N13_116171 [Hibiscus sabdariffa]|uniref:Uncharacterized protein n=2 Tax=Hibiscus sabdariffa TaxID=183260 RepID=A0ABR2BNB8_9ROSI